MVDSERTFLRETLTNPLGSCTVRLSGSMWKGSMGGRCPAGLPWMTVLRASAILSINTECRLCRIGSLSLSTWMDGSEKRRFSYNIAIDQNSIYVAAELKTFRSLILSRVVIYYMYHIILIPICQMVHRISILIKDF